MVTFTTFSTGSILATEVNDNFSCCYLQRKNVSVATEQSSPVTSYVDGTGTSFDITNGLNGLLVSVYCTVDLKVGGNTQSVSMKVSGTNLGDLYVVGHRFRDALSEDDSYFPGLSTSESAVFNHSESTYKTFCFDISPGLKLLDETTTFVLRNKSDGGDDAWFQNFVCRVVYSRGFNDI